MNLSVLLAPLREQPAYLQLLDLLRDKSSPAEALEIPKAVRPMLVSALTEDLQQPVLYISHRLQRLLTLREEMPNWTPHIELHQFPNPNPLFYELSPWSETVRNERIAALAALTRGEGPGTPAEEIPLQSRPVLLASSRAVMTRTLAKRTFLANSRYVKQGGVFRFDQLLTLLVNNGYAQSSLVTERGQFSRRGGILDLWPPADPFPIRLDFFGDDVESLRRFDPSSQRTIQEVSWVRVTPAREGLRRDFNERWIRKLPGINSEDDPFVSDSLELFLPLMNSHPTGVADFLSKDAFVVFDDKTAFTHAVADIEQQALSMKDEAVDKGQISQDFPLPYLTLADLEESLEDHVTLDLGMSARIGDSQTVPLGNSFTPGPRFGGQLETILKHLQNKRTNHETVIVVSRQAKRLCELWSEYDHDAEVEQDVVYLNPGEITFIQGPLSGGWTHDREQGNRIHVLSDAELFGWSRPRPRRRSLARPSAPEESFSDLEHGDFVVHIDYGIGRFVGLVERRLEGIQREYLLIEYANDDQLYIPVHQADRISRYVGADSTAPSMSRLGSSEWTRSKNKTKEAVEQVARDLLALYAERQTVQGTAFPPDTPWQTELEASFAHQETDDQIQALEAIKGDMEKPKPMDRLICGDVGYGKTEVALRAAFKAVMHGKQTAILVPTTVLAQQHFNTFRRRLSAFPVKVEMLSRFRTRSETAKIIGGLISGEIDIVIGTHRLLQPDIQFKDLGLLIIDEEQRFGVTHKEFLKRMRTEVDVLTLTATPIPRTLYMALTGARDISTISTPPEDRLPVRTHVGLYDPQLVRSAILRELDRGGQVFFVHNRVQTIATMRRRLERLVPEARFTIAHGQMPEGKLSQTMKQFSGGEIDVLVSTSIIESGLDIPNANTLIVDRADRFGLAQLYQLRGRVGRAAIQGFAYFFRAAGQKATEEALQRLEIIAEHSQLGAGYAIAMRDMEMRGAGDILGTRQHGYIASVGFHLYTRLLTSAVRHMRREMGHDLDLPDEVSKTSELPPAAIDLPLPALIPEEYISSRDLRLQLYRRLAEIRSLDGLESIDAELRDRFGPTPNEVLNLLYQLKVKIMATNAGIERITTEGQQILIDLPEKRTVPGVGVFGEGVRRSKRGLWLSTESARGWEKRLIQLLNHIKEYS